MTGLRWHSQSTLVPKLSAPGAPLESEPAKVSASLRSHSVTDLGWRKASALQRQVPKELLLAMQLLADALPGETRG